MLVAAACSAALSALWFGVVYSDGAIGVPRNDDWLYSRQAFALSETGSFVPEPFSLTMLIGQLWAVRPVIAVWGQSLVALQTWCALLAAVGCVFGYLIARSFLGRLPSVLAASCMALSPVYATLSISFMTDVPAAALMLTSLFVAQVALRNGPARRRLLLMAAALSVFLLAFSIREYAVAVPVSIAILMCWKKPAAWRSGLLLVGVFVALAAVLVAWKAGLSGGRELTGVGIRWAAIWPCLALLITVTFFATPVLLCVFWRRVLPSTGRGWRVLAIAVVAVLWTLTAAHVGGPVIGDYFSRSGSYDWTLSGTHDPVFDVLTWACLTGVGLVGILGFSAVMIESRRTHSVSPVDAATNSSEQLVVVFVLTYLSLVAVKAVLVDGFLVDRYVLVLLPLVPAIVLSRILRSGLGRVRIMHVVLAAASLMLLSLVTVDTAAVFDAAKHQAGEAAVRLGYPAQRVDAGYEWWGSNHDGAIRATTLTSSDVPLWYRLFDDQDVCVVFASVDEQEMSSASIRVEQHGLFGATTRLAGRPLTDPAHCG